MKKCPFCYATNLKKSYKVGNHQYFACKSCLTLFLSPLPSEKKLRTYYRQEFEYTAGLANEELVRKRSRVIISNLKKLNPNGRTLLDVGSGLGYFLDEAKKVNLKVLGIEPSKKLCQYSKKHYQIEVANTDFEGYSQSKFKKRKFDFITVIHTIEHVINPEKMLSKAKSLLKEEGILFIETPNVNSHLFNVLGKNYDFLTPPHHPWLFSKKSFQIMLSKLKDLRIEKISTYSYPEHFMGILKRLIKGGKEVSRTDTREQKITAASKSKSLPLNKKLKILLFDKGIARLMYPLLNLFDKGSILELYIKKI